VVPTIYGIRAIGRMGAAGGVGLFFFGKNNRENRKDVQGILFISRFNKGIGESNYFFWERWAMKT